MCRFVSDFVNGAYGSNAEIEKNIRNIRGQIPGSVILMDLPGNKVRTANIEVGVHVRGIHKDIPFLFEKDRQLVGLANEYRLDFVGLSFVRTPENVKEAKFLLGEGTQVISEIGITDTVEHINEILPLVRYILVDRGDLSTDIGIEKIPYFQKYIIDKALYFDVKVFLATQVLKHGEQAHPHHRRDRGAV